MPNTDSHETQDDLHIDFKLLKKIPVREMPAPHETRTLPRAAKVWRPPGDPAKIEGKPRVTGRLARIRKDSGTAPTTRESLQMRTTHRKAMHPDAPRREEPFENIAEEDRLHRLISPAPPRSEAMFEVLPEQESAQEAPVRHRAERRTGSWWNQPFENYRMVTRAQTLPSLQVRTATTDMAPPPAARREHSPHSETAESTVSSVDHLFEKMSERNGYTTRDSTAGEGGMTPTDTHWPEATGRELSPGSEAEESTTSSVDHLFEKMSHKDSSVTLVSTPSERYRKEMRTQELHLPQATPDPTTLSWPADDEIKLLSRSHSPVTMRRNTPGTESSVRPGEAPLHEPPARAVMGPEIEETSSSGQYTFTYAELRESLSLIPENTFSDTGSGYQILRQHSSNSALHFHRPVPDGTLRIQASLNSFVQTLAERSPQSTPMFAGVTIHYTQGHTVAPEPFFRINIAPHIAPHR